jgi:hypothetical protein
MVFALPIHMHGEGEIFAGLEQVQFLFQQQRISAQVDVLFSRN